MVVHGIMMSHKILSNHSAQENFTVKQPLALNT